MANFVPEFERKHFSSEVHGQLYDYWLRRKGDRLMPSRQDIGPEEIPSLLPHLIMLDVYGKPGHYQFKVRLTGTQVDQIVGQSLTGKWAHDFPNSEGLSRRFCWLVENRRPYYSEDRLMFVSKDFKNYSCLVCPLSSDGQSVDKILASNDYY
ncbi:PAS domain-containing protein [Emcibacter nanhaiensis]|uniref:PAS domain-containing protein n=1 Tax=Emcibacter nanhaiensis TaxID=1505037 RepID=A0A501PBC9_9PROT|nr:PAS domain-containing protein [Emcibacter nanhaiensis]TPD57673.1 PAS domain-containing protein [Emcibacter nanhaiensis]